MNSLDASGQAKSHVKNVPGGAAPETPQREPGAANSVSTTVELSTEHYRWRCAKDHVGLLTGADSPDWLSLRTEPAAELVKRNGPREVWRVRTGSEEVFAKLHRPVGAGDWLKALVRGPASRREWKAARYALAAGLSATVPLACGWGRGPRKVGRGILLTRSVPNAVPLDKFWLQAQDCRNTREQYRRERRICEALADALARTHQNGLRHLDLHAGNLLIQPESQDRLKIVLVDLQAARISRTVSDREVLKNLVQLNQWFRRHATASSRLRFFRRYLDRRERLMDSAHARRLRFSERTMLEKLHVMADRHARRLWAKRDRVAMRNGRYFSRIRIPGGWRGHALLEPRRRTAWMDVRNASFTRSQWRQWLDDPAEWIKPRDHRLIKGSHSGTVYRTHLPLDDGPLDVVCKRSLPRTWFKRLYYPFTRSRNLETWRRGYALLNRDLPTARPLAVLERRLAGLLLDSIVITEAVQDGHDLDTMLRLHLAPQAERIQRKIKDLICERLAVLVVQLHERGFIHRDFKASNILAQWSAAQPDRLGLALVDLDGLRRRRRAGTHNELKALARLNVSLDLCTTVTVSDRVRFLRAYLRKRGGTESGWRQLWRTLGHMSDRKRRKKAARTQWKIDHYGRP
jgi:tRNA A-37 threonylcarbamoyl transferase component Bud32